MFKWSGWNKYTRNKLNQIAGGGSGGGPGGVKFVPIYLTSNSGGTITLTEDQMRELDNAISSISDGCIPYLDVLVTGGMVPSHSLFFYGYKQTNPRALTFVGGTRIAFYFGLKIFFAEMEQPKLPYYTTSSNIVWNRSGADVLVKCETERSNFTDRKFGRHPMYRPVHEATAKMLGLSADEHAQWMEKMVGSMF